MTHISYILHCRSEYKAEVQAISVDLLEKDLSADQQMQLYELMKETTKPAPQFSNIKESTTFIDKKTD